MTNLNYKRLAAGLAMAALAVSLTGHTDNQLERISLSAKTDFEKAVEKLKPKHDSIPYFVKSLENSEVYKI